MNKPSELSRSIPAFGVKRTCWGGAPLACAAPSIAKKQKHKLPHMVCAASDNDATNFVLQTSFGLEAVCGHAEGPSVCVALLVTSVIAIQAWP